MTFQISPHIHLAWPNVPSTTPKFSCDMHARWLFKSHLASTWDDIRKVYKGKFLQIFLIWPWDIKEVTSNSKVLMRGSQEMNFQISPCVHLVWPSVPSTTPKFPKKSCSNPDSINKVPLTSHQKLFQEIKQAWTTGLPWWLKSTHSNLTEILWHNDTKGQQMSFKKNN